MKIICVTGACGVGKSTMRDMVGERLDEKLFACIDTDECGINWHDYANTDHPEGYANAYLAEAVRRAAGRTLVLFGCTNPMDYITKNTIPDEVEATYFVTLVADDDVIHERLLARPAERGFNEGNIPPHIEYNRWFRRNRGKFPLQLDTGKLSQEETADRIAEFATGLER